ncbi:MAG: hypothetical protein ACI9ES_003275, partial [Oceanospirillaceae bacterium]
KQEQADRKPAVQVKKAVKRARVKPAVDKKNVVASNAQINEKTDKADISGKAKSSPKALIKTPVKVSTKSPVKENKIAVKSVIKAASSIVLKPASHKKPAAIDSQNTASASAVEPISSKEKAVDKVVLGGGK